MADRQNPPLVLDISTLPPEQQAAIYMEHLERQTELAKMQLDSNIVNMRKIMSENNEFNVIIETAMASVKEVHHQLCMATDATAKTLEKMAELSKQACENTQAELNASSGVVGMAPTGNLPFVSTPAREQVTPVSTVFVQPQTAPKRVPFSALPPEEQSALRMKCMECQTEIKKGFMNSNIAFMDYTASTAAAFHASMKTAMDDTWQLHSDLCKASGFLNRKIFHMAELSHQVDEQAQAKLGSAQKRSKAILEWDPVESLDMGTGHGVDPRDFLAFFNSLELVSGAASVQVATVPAAGLTESSASASPPPTGPGTSDWDDM